MHEHTGSAPVLSITMTLSVSPSQRIKASRPTFASPGSDYGREYSPDRAPAGKVHASKSRGAAVRFSVDLFWSFRRPEFFKRVRPSYRPYHLLDSQRVAGEIFAKGIWARPEISPQQLDGRDRPNPMTWNRLFRLSFPALISLVLIGCQISPENALAAEEERLATGGDLSKYHYLVREPYSVGLSHEGFIIGIEKSPKEKIGYEFPDIDVTRFRKWDTRDDPQGGQYIEARNAHFRRVTSDRKSVFVSHILKYGFDRQGTVRFAVCPLYSVYKANGFADQSGRPGCPANGQTETSKTTDAKPYYEDGWSALNRLYDAIKARLDQARPAYTHILVASMGWNNDQVESVRRYNALLGNIIAQARLEGTPEGQYFNPLVIGLTWPSVWGGDSFFNTINLVTHVVSYPNKADDADEIGYTIANYLVNNIVYRLKSEYKLKIVLIAHSLGARILSRAMFSAHLLKGGPNPTGDATDLFIGLQGAFSVRRFKKDHRLPFPLSLFRKGEGSPYLIYDKLDGRVVLTWSEADAANPVAQWVTGAAHAGGKAGYEESREMGDVFDHLVWDKNVQNKNDLLRQNITEKAPATCGKLKESKKVLMIDANKIVHDHNDILDSEMGRLIWKNIACFTYPKTSNLGFLWRAKSILAAVA